MRIGMDARALMTDMTDPKTKFRLRCGPFWRIWANIAPDPLALQDLDPFKKRFLTFLHGICGFFFLGSCGPGFGPGGRSQDPIPTAVLISILSSNDIPKPNLCKVSSLIWRFTFCYSVHRYLTKYSKTMIEYKAFSLFSSKSSAASFSQASRFHKNYEYGDWASLQQEAFRPYIGCYGPDAANAFHRSGLG
jgi:hypothetical protein